MNCTKPCRALMRAGVLVAALALAPSAFAHAHLYPDEVASDHDALIQVAVPNEEKNASTTEITMMTWGGAFLDAFKAAADEYQKQSGVRVVFVTQVGAVVGPMSMDLSQAVKARCSVVVSGARVCPYSEKAS